MTDRWNILEDACDKAIRVACEKPGRYGGCFLVALLCNPCFAVDWVTIPNSYAGNHNTHVKISPHVGLWTDTHNSATTSVAAAENDYGKAISILGTSATQIGADHVLLTGLEWFSRAKLNGAQSAWAKATADGGAVDTVMADSAGIGHGAIEFDVPEAWGSIAASINSLRVHVKVGKVGLPQSEIVATYYGGVEDRWVYETIKLRNALPGGGMEVLDLGFLNLWSKGFASLDAQVWPISEHVVFGTMVSRSVKVNLDLNDSRMFVSVSEEPGEPVLQEAKARLLAGARVEDRP